MTIDYQELKDTIASLLSTRNEDMIMATFSGLLAGLSLAEKDRKLASTIDHNLRTQWEATHGLTALVDAGAPYGPGMMAERMIREFSPKAGQSN